MSPIAMDRKYLPLSSTSGDTLAAAKNSARGSAILTTNLAKAWVATSVK